MHEWTQKRRPQREIWGLRNKPLTETWQGRTLIVMACILGGWLINLTALWLTR